MSLFANENYRWRETYFVLFRREDLPSIEQVREAFLSLGDAYQVTDLSIDEDGLLEVMTVLAPLDFSGMDISFVEGEEVTEQVGELKGEIQLAGCTKHDQAKLKKLGEADARFDIYHFQQIVDDPVDDEDEYMDPGSLLQVLACLNRLCNGVSIDPQSGLLM
jgi:hypothetical protein